MASIYKKGNRLYISWYDKLSGKRINRSLNLTVTPENIRKAEQFAREFQKELDKLYQNFILKGIVKSSIKKAFEHFLKINSFKNPKTIKEYKNFYNKFTQYFNENDPCSEITKSTSEDFLISLQKYHYAQNTLYGITKNLKKFLNFLFEYNYIPIFKLNSDVTYKPEVKQVIIFSLSDLELMLSRLEEKNDNFKTTFYLLLFTGLRPSDIINIKTEDIDFDHKLLRYYSPKTRTYNIIPIHEDLVPLLKHRCEQITNGRLIDYATIGEMGKAMRRFFKSLGLDKKGYDLRTFRKTYISLLYMNNVDLASAKRLVGHKELKTTEKYYTVFSADKLRNELSKLKLPSVTTHHKKENDEL
ncbi:MAG: tyrosine-type recombinase/integrase [Ignavibacteria bacterium]|nr:tyrosine-type recombinase/integrase [Ignavibacteria bacterium]